MSKPANSWYGIVLKTIRRYPELKARKEDLQSMNITANYSAMPRSGVSSRTTENIAIKQLAPADERELLAVEKTIEVINRHKDGEDILKVIDLVDFKRTHLLNGAAIACNISEKTAKRRRRIFINECAHQLGYF